MTTIKLAGQAVSVDQGNLNVEPTISEIMEEYAALKEQAVELAAHMKPLEDRMKELKKDVKDHLIESGTEVAYGFKFELRISQRINVAGWMADRVKAGEDITGLSLGSSTALYVTREDE